MQQKKGWYLSTSLPYEMLSYSATTNVTLFLMDEKPP